MHHALLAALAPESLSPRRHDTYGLGEEESLGRVPPATRALVAATPEEIAEMSRYPVVSGHFRLQTLLQVTTPDRIATLVREPRARLLSLFAFGRAVSALGVQWSTELDQESWVTHAQRPLDEFLAEPSIAASTDNIVSRMAIDGAVAFPEGSFLESGDRMRLAEAAIERLDGIAFTGVLELGPASWSGLVALFGVDLSPGHDNATRDVADGPPPRSDIGPITVTTLELLERRTALDQLVYRRALARNGVQDEADARKLADAAFAAQLVRLGALQESLEGSRYRPRIAELESSLALSRAELDHHRAWLQDVTQSVSWRGTAPLRALKRRLVQGSVSKH